MSGVAVSWECLGAIKCSRLEPDVPTGAIVLLRNINVTN